MAEATLVAPCRATSTDWCRSLASIKRVTGTSPWCGLEKA
jgi:hypothetical protein